MNEEQKQLVAKTLSWVNQVRAEFSQPPLETLPKGERRECLGCPIARALRMPDRVVRVSGEFIRVVPDSDSLEQRRDMPDFAQEFISLFDEGELPELDLAVVYVDDAGQLVGTIPDYIVAACTQSGSVDSAVESARDELGFTVPRSLAIDYLASTGGWERDELAGKTNVDLAEIVLWLACGDIAETGEWLGLDCI